MNQFKKNKIVADLIEDVSQEVSNVSQEVSNVAQEVSEVVADVAEEVSEVVADVAQEAQEVAHVMTEVAQDVAQVVTEVVPRCDRCFFMRNLGIQYVTDIPRIVVVSKRTQNRLIGVVSINNCNTYL